MKKNTFGKLLFFSLTCIPVGMEAQEKMIVSYTDGTPAKEFVLSDIGKMTFDNENLTVSGMFGNVLFSYPQIMNIKFSGLVIDNIADIQTDNSRLNFRIQSRTLYIEGISEGNVNIFTAGGRMVYSDPRWKGGSISLNSLPTGIYIIKINNKTNKFIL